MIAHHIWEFKKLLKLIVDLGFERREIVSGIALNVESHESFIGKKVVIVANLKTAKLMGVESQGMILCAAREKELEILNIQERILAMLFVRA